MNINKYSLNVINELEKSKIVENIFPLFYENFSGLEQKLKREVTILAENINDKDTFEYVN